MQERAIVYFVIAYLACWFVDLLILCTRTPFQLDPALKAIIVIICLVIVMIGLAKQRWLLP